MSTDCNVNCIKFFTEFVKLNFAFAVTNFSVQLNFYAGGKDSFDILVKSFAREAIAGNTVAEHTAKFSFFFKYYAMVTHQFQIVSSGKTGRTTADNCNAFAGSFSFLRNRNSIRRSIIYCHAFQTTNVNRSVNYATTATSFTGMFADKSAGGGEGIVFADEFNCISVTTFANESDVTGDVNLCRAKCNARNGSVYAAMAFTGFDVVNVVVAETVQTS